MKLIYRYSDRVTLKSKDLEGEWSTKKDILYSYKIRYKEFIDNILD